MTSTRPDDVYEKRRNGDMSKGNNHQSKRTRIKNWNSSKAKRTAAEHKNRTKCKKRKSLSKRHNGRVRKKNKT